MKIRIITVLALALPGMLIGSLLSYSSTKAVSGSDWRAGNIIDDAIFTDKNAMSVADIQNFLNKRVGTTGRAGAQPGICDTNGIKTSEYGGGTRAQYGAANNNPSPFTCLKDYYEVPKTSPGPGMPANNYGGKPIPSGAKSAAQLIYDAGQAHNISPKVLLVKLGTESAGPLTGDDWPFLSQYRYAMGAHCPDSGPNGSANCDPNYAGFSLQMLEAAALMRYYLNNMTASWWPYKKPFQNNNILFNVTERNCGSSSVYISSYATAALYTYTPYQPNQAALNNLYGTGDFCSAYGNRNFWRVFNDWFGSTSSGRNSSPLYKSTTGDTIYAVSEGKKYPLANLDVMNAFGLDKYGVSIVTDAMLNNYSTGTAISTTLAKKADDPSGTIYLFDDGKRYPIPIGACKKNIDGTDNTTTSWNLDCFNSNVVKSISNNLIDTYTNQDITLPNLILYQDSAWKIELGKKNRITDGAFIDLLGGWGNVRWMQTINASQPVGKMLILDGSAVKFDNSPTIYLLNNAKFYPVLSPDDYSAWGLPKRPNYTFPAAYNSFDPIEIASPLGFCAADINTNQKYMLALNSTRSPLSASQYNGICTTMTNSVLSAIPIVQSNLFRSQTGEIFTIQDGKRYGFPTVEDVTYSGFQMGQLQQVSTSAALSFEYGGSRMSPGRLFKVTGSDTIRYVFSEGASLNVYSSNTPGLPYGKLITVDAATGARYPVIGNL